MGKKRKNKDRVDPSLPPSQKVAKLVERSESKTETRDFAAAEKYAREAVALAREHFYNDENNLLHARSNLQVAFVQLKQGHYSKARKPLEIAQKVAEASSDHWLRSEVYGALAAACFLQKKKGNGMSEEGKNWRMKQEKEEEKARQKELAAGPKYEGPPGAMGMGPVGMMPPPPGGYGYMAPPPMMMMPQGMPLHHPGVPAFPPVAALSPGVPAFPPVAALSPGVPAFPPVAALSPGRGNFPPVAAPTAPAAGAPPLAQPPVAASAPAASPKAAPQAPASIEQPQTAATAAPAATSPGKPAPGSGRLPHLIWSEDSLSMEEKRALLVKYSPRK
ncbi:hypothetical protein HKI87_07g46150 [Chloropicon roscoffensis]|uniref:Uncharacterized protein n=1 Tax=Chloropicon roscoffensis TaxID=1461544 RepID=A0AAX4P9N1_9CHLO